MSGFEVEMNEAEIHKLDNSQLAALLAQLNGVQPLVEELKFEEIAPKVEEIQAQNEEIVVKPNEINVVPGIAAMIANINRCEIEANVALMKVANGQHDQDRLKLAILALSEMNMAIGAIAAAIRKMSQ